MTRRLKTYGKVIRRVQKKLTKSGATRYYDFSYDQSQRKFTIIEKKEEIEGVRALCGYYILQTSEIAMQDERVEGYYKQLREVEDVFRDLKDLIDIRPVYHWIDRRVKTHIFLCLLSLGSLRRGTKKAQGRRLAGEEKRAHSGKVHHPFGRLKPPLHKNGSTREESDPSQQGDNSLDILYLLIEDYPLLFS